MKSVKIILDKDPCRPQTPQRTDLREAKDRDGYLKKPQSTAESHAWEAETSWPEE